MSTNKPGIKSFNINGTEYDLQAIPENVKLSEDLYTYTPIGMAKTASNEVLNSGNTAIGNENPAKLGNTGDSLASVLTKIFGTQADKEPDINSKVGISSTTSTTSFGGSSVEYGASVAEATDTYVEFTLDNTGTTSTSKYGNTYVCKDGSKKQSTNFYYPVIKQDAKGTKSDETAVTATDKADLVITLPKNKRASIASGGGTLVSSNTVNNITTLYCNFNTSKKVKLTLTLPASTVKTTNETRYEGIKAEVKLGDAQTENSLTPVTEESKKIDKFLTYLDDMAEQQPTSKKEVTIDNTSSEFRINAGYAPYVYCLLDGDNAVQNMTNLPSATRQKARITQATVSGGNSNTYLYFFMPAADSDVKTIKSGGFTVNFKKVATSKSLVVNNGVSTTYDVFRTNASVVGNTFDLTY